MSAVWVPPGQQNFFGQDGKPLSLGSVGLYIPNTLTPKLSWADEAQTVANPAVISLDAAGAAPIWGTGLYREIVKDASGVTIFDKITGFIASGGGGGGDVFGPGASIPGNFAVWASTDGTQIADGGAVGTLAHLNTVDDANWGATPLSLPHGGTGGTDAATARAGLGLGALAVLNTITASYVTDFDTEVEAFMASSLVQGTNVTIVHNGGAHTFTISASGGSGGGDVTGPGVAVNGGLVQFDGTTGTLVKDSTVVPSTDGFSLIAAANYAAMRTALSLTTAATTALGTSGATIPLLSTANTWTLAQTFTVAPVFTDASGTRSALGLGTASTAAATDFEPAGAYSAQNNQTGTTYTLVLTDKGKLVTTSNASAVTLTVPTNASVAFPVLTRIDLISIGAGQTSVAAAGGVTVNSAGGALKLRIQHSGASLVKTGTDTWQLVGDITT